MARYSDPFTLEFSLLGFLHQRSLHGYQLYKLISGLGGMGQIWRVKQSMLYAILERMEKDGLVSSILLPSDGRPPRKEYHLTPAGEAAFLEWISTPVEHARDMRQEFLARLFFARQQGSQAALSLLHRQQEACQMWLERLQKRANSQPPSAEFESYVLGYRLLQVQAMCTWLGNCIAMEED